MMSAEKASVALRLPGFFPHSGKQLLVAEQTVFAKQRLDGLKQHGNSFHCIKYFN